MDDETILKRLREDPRLDYLIAWQQALALRAIATSLEAAVLAMSPANKQVKLQMMSADLKAAAARHGVNV